MAIVVKTTTSGEALSLLPGIVHARCGYADSAMSDVRKPFRIPGGTRKAACVHGRCPHATGDVRDARTGRCNERTGTAEAQIVASMSLLARSVGAP